MTPAALPPATGGPDPDATGPDTAPAGTRRSGQLYRQVALYLASKPDTVLKVGEVTAAIGAPSSGAVFEALKRMAAAGYATHHTGPHRFQVTQAGIDAAGALPPPAPRTSSSGSPRTSKRRQPLLRPNGERYFPRRLAGATDIDVLRRLRDKKIPVLLYGPPGTGKTAFRVRSACCSRSCCLVGEVVWQANGTCSGSVTATPTPPRTRAGSAAGPIWTSASGGWGSPSGSRSWCRLTCGSTRG